MRTSNRLHAAVVIAGFHILLGRIANGCVCLNENRNLAASYCSTDFAVQAVIESSTFDPPGSNMFTAMSKTYNITIIKAFKAPASLSNETSWIVHTGATDSMCGVELDLNAKYLLTGFVNAGEPVLSLCRSWVQAWSQVLPWDRKRLRQSYRGRCNAAVSY